MGKLMEDLPDLELLTILEGGRMASGGRGYWTNDSQLAEDKMVFVNRRKLSRMETRKRHGELRFGRWRLPPGQILDDVQVETTTDIHGVS